MELENVFILNKKVESSKITNNMFEKRLSKEDLEELRKRTELINQYILISQSLEIQKQVFIKSILSSYGMRGDRNYSIDLKNGKITEEKEKKENTKPS